MPKPLGRTISTAVSTTRPTETIAQPKTSASASVSSPPAWQGVGGRRPATATQSVAQANEKSEVICPVLRSMINEGRVTMRADGTISLDELKKGLKGLGASDGVGAATWALGTVGNSPFDILNNLLKHELNVKDLPNGVVPHPAASLILRNGKFDENRFQALVSHAENGVMTTDSIANAIAANFKRDVKGGASVLDARLRGLNSAYVEFSGLLAVFGHKDAATGKTGITVDDLRTLYQQGTIPPGMLGQKSDMVEVMALQASLKVKTDAALAGSALGSIFSSFGLARAGARLAGATTEGTDQVASQLASVSAGKAAACPHLSGKVKMPVSPANVVNAHTPAGMN